jgi:hypothetical protein
MYLFIYYNNIIIIYIIIYEIKKQEIPKKKKLSKFFDFLAYFSINFALYWFAFLHCKDTNPVLKYLIFSEMLQKKYRKQKKYLVFMHTTMCLKNVKNSYHIFIQKFQEKGMC